MVLENKEDNCDLIAQAALEFAALAERDQEFLLSLMCQANNGKISDEEFSNALSVNVAK